jgi:MFS family permease
VFLRILIGVLLLLHGVIHCILAASPNPGSAEPVAATFFSEWASPWLRGMLSGRALQTVAIVLAVMAGVGFIAAGLAMFGILLPHDWWRALAIGSSVVSLVLCVLFWNVYLVVGPVVAIGTIVAVGFIQWPTEAILGY